MKSTNTPGLRFIARPANSSGQLHIYVRITVKKRRVEISLQKTVARSHWDAKIGCACCNRDVMRKINPYIEEVRSKLMECFSELQLKHRPLACHTLKALFLGEEQPEHTLCSLITYHNTNMIEVLSPGTLKNYFTTEKYVKLFLQKNIAGRTSISRNLITSLLASLNFSCEDQHLCRQIIHSLIMVL